MPSVGLEFHSEPNGNGIEISRGNQRKRRRGGRKRNKKSKDVSMYYVNINGYQSKRDSLEVIIKSIQPEIVALVETKVGKNKVFKEWEPHYQCLKRNCSRGKGGIMCAFKNGTFKSARNVTSVDDDRILTCRVEYDNRTVRVIVVYGPQETDELELRNDFYVKLGLEIEKCNNAGEGLLIIGDLNAKIKADEEKNILYDSGNGRLLAETVHDFGLEVVNFSDCCRGTWTWTKRVRGVLNKSTLDYMLVDKEILKMIQELEIDEEKSLCPFHKTNTKTNTKRVKGTKKGKKTKKGTKKIVYSDHNPLICKLGLLPSKVKTRKEPRWIITQKGLEKFKEETTIFSIDQGCSDKYSELEKSMFQSMSKCFRRVWRKQQEQEQCCSQKQLKLLKLLYKFKTKGKAQRVIIGKYIREVHASIAEKIADMKRKRIEKTVNSLTVDRKFSTSEFWKLKKRLCPKATVERSSVVLENGDELSDDNAIRNAYREEFMNRLKHNEIDDRYGNYEIMSNLLCDLYVAASRAVLSPDFTIEEAWKVRQGLKNKKAPGLDQITNEILKNAGDGLLEEMVAVINDMKNNSESPKQWNQVLITTLFKNKGTKKKLVNYRGIFLTSCISKLCEKLIMLRINEPLKSVSLAQCGATQDKSAADNVFILNACIDHAKYLNQPLYLAFYDFQQCFDKLWLEDCLIGLWKVGIRDQMLSLISSMNEECEVVVQSPCGRTEPFQINRIVKQGTVIGPQLCKVSTAEYGGDTPGYQLGSVNIKPPIFVDDILNILGNIADMSEAHRKAVLFSLRKRINFGVLKCIVMIVNAKKSSVPPVLEIDGHVLAQEEKAKYVGDFFNRQGTNVDLIEDRIKKGKGKMISLLALCEESGLGRYTVSSMIVLYQMVFIPMLISNCQGWSHITKSNFESLERLQLKFLKLILWLPMSTPNAFIFLEYGILPLEHEIQKRRITYLHHILSLRDGDPTKLAYLEGLKLSHEPNWANNVLSLRLKYGVSFSDQEVSQMSVSKWKEIVSDQVDKLVFHELLEKSKSLSKIRDIEYDVFGSQRYLSTMDAFSIRKIARLRSRTFACKANQKSAHNSNLFCRAGCSEIESQDHLLNCKNILGDVSEINCDFVKKEAFDYHRRNLQELLRRIDVVESWCEE